MTTPGNKSAQPVAVAGAPDHKTGDQPPARYQNFQHYITEGWTKEPKFVFRAVAQAARAIAPSRPRILDIGCATGEFVAYLRSQIPDAEIVGIDIFDELIDTARQLLPAETFIKSDFLALPPEHDGGYDLVLAVGIISLFEGEEADRFWEKAAACLKPGGTVIVLGPLNEFGVDLSIRHRKWLDGERGNWERGWSIPSRASVELAIGRWFRTSSITPYTPELDLEPRPDPVRTWTVPYAGKPRQLTNGMKLLVDYNLIVATR